MFAVIPAAGTSRRMGRPKLLLPWGGTTVIGRVLSLLDRPEIAATAVVVRRDDEPLLAAVAAAGATPLCPATPPPEMRDSVEHALRWLEQEWRPQAGDGWLLSPADHPLLEGVVLDRLLQAWRECPGHLLVPTCRGRRGHPVLFRWELAQDVFSLPPDVGLNALVRQHAAETVELEAGSESILCDLDTPAEYERALAQWSGLKSAGGSS